MGSWLGTCGISNLPIAYGTPIRAVLIVGHHYKFGDNIVRSPSTWRPDVELEFVDEEGNKHEYADRFGKRKIVPESNIAKDKNDKWREGWWSGYVSTEDIFFPRCVAIKGKYDDYGGIDQLEQGLNQQVVSDQFMLDLDEYPEGKYRIPDAITRGMPLEKLLKIVERNAVTVNRFKDKPSKRPENSLPVGLWMIREDIYQAILGSEVKSRGLGATMKLQTFLDDADGYCADLLTRAELDRFIKAALNDPDPTVRNSSFSSLLNRSSDNALRRSMHEPPFENGLAFYDDWIMEHVAAGTLQPDSPELKALLQEIAEFSFFCIAKESMRVGWMPQAGAGSQDDRIEAHAAVAKQMLKTIELMRAEQAEDE